MYSHRKLSPTFTTFFVQEVFKRQKEQGHKGRPDDVSYVRKNLQYSRCPGLPASSLPVCPCLPVFFFRATPSPRFTGGMPVYRGGSFFHARGAPPAAAHSHTRCCTQHNTTRWVLRAAANTCLHTMPCAAGELCQLSDSTTTPEFSCCGPCGGPLHRICGDPDDKEEVNRICEPCAAAKKSTSSTNDHSNAAKRKEGGGILQQSAPKKRKGETRKRLTSGQKREILQLLDQKVSRVEVARRFNCEGGRRLAPPPPFSELSSLFGPLEKYAESCGISGAAYHLRKAKMDFIHARSSKPAVQADIRAIFSDS